MALPTPTHTKLGQNQRAWFQLVNNKLYKPFNGLSITGYQFNNKAI